MKAQHNWTHRLLALTSLLLVCIVLFASCNAGGNIPTDTSKPTEEHKPTDTTPTDKETDAGNNQTEPHIHTWSDWVVTKEPTDIENGEQKRECACGETETQAIVTIDNNPQGLDFYLQDDGSYAVAVGKARLLSHIDIPATYKQKSVTSIANDGFSDCSLLTTITLPASITSIGSRAFANCSLLISITLPDNVTSIGLNAFSNCTSLKIIDLPSSLTNINQRVFNGCINLASITIPNSVKSIGSNAFYNCSNLTSITFKGTTSEWERIELENYWFALTPIAEIICLDGTISNVSDSDNFHPTSGKAYILHPVKVRETAKLSSKASVGVAAWGSEVERIETNGTWTKIKFKDAITGTFKQGYVIDEILTSNKKQVTLVKLETPVAATIKGLGTTPSGTPYTLNIRTTPWNCAKSEEYANVNVLANIVNKKYQVKDGDAVEKLGTTEDGKWVWIRFAKIVDGVEVVEYGFCAIDFVKVEGTEPPIATPDDNPTNNTPVNPEPIL